MMEFSAARLVRVIQNDVLRIARPVLFTTVALFGLTLLIYLFNHQRLISASSTLPMGLLATYLVVTGLLLTGSAFQDMHHRLDRYQYLMLPIASFERLLSRYLLTGPLFLLYSLVAFAIFDLVGKQLLRMYWEVDAPPFPLFTDGTRWLVYSYAFAHVVMLIGAICFRTHAFLRTILVLLALVLAMVVVENLAERIFFPELFSWTQFEILEPLPVEIMPGFASDWMNIAFAVGALGWLLYVAYLCLRDHEASDGV